MAVDEASRRRLFDRLEEVLGVEDAATLMGHLPPGGWDHLATRHDVDQVGTELRTELVATRHDVDRVGTELRTELVATRHDVDRVGTELRTELVATRHDVDQLRNELHAQGTDLRTEMQAQGTQLRTEMQGLRFELLAALHQEVAGALTAQTRMVIFTMAGTIALLGSLVIGILGLQ